MSEEAAAPAGGLDLHGAARAGDVDRIKELVTDENTEINARDKLNRTALHMAAWAGKAEAVKALLQAGADVNAKAADDVTPLMFASQGGHAGAVAAIADDKRSQINAQNSKTKQTALHLAAMKGHLEVIQILLKHRANLTYKDKHGKRPVDVAKAADVRHVLEEAAKPKQSKRPDGGANAAKRKAAAAGGEGEGEGDAGGEGSDADGAEGPSAKKKQAVPSVSAAAAAAEEEEGAAGEGEGEMIGPIGPPERPRPAPAPAQKSEADPEAGGAGGDAAT
eukprot:tig00000404_g380.t1